MRWRHLLATVSVSGMLPIAGCLTLSVQGAAPPEPQVPIAANGQSQTVIVLPAAAVAEEKNAASELALYVRKITGCELRTVTEDSTATGPQVHVGRTREALAAVGPVELDGLDPDGLVIRTRGSDRLFLIGRNPWGTEFAVYRFLYQAAGMRWYMPTETGEHVPQRPVFTVPAMNRVENPAWLSRQWSAADRADRGEWNRRNLIRPRFAFHHYLNVWIPPELFDQHPDWFPLRPKGERYRPRNKDDHSWQPCLSNPAVAQFVAERIIDSFDRDSAKLSASIGVNDSGWQGYCQCDGCQALDVPGKLSVHGGPDYSNRFFTFANRVAAVVSAKYPERTVGCLAYNACENPPTFAVHPMIVPYLTNDRAQWRDAEFAAADRAWIAAWRAVCPSIATYTYEYGAGYVIPRLYVPLQEQYMRYCRDQGVKGWYAEIYCNWMLDGPKAWLASQLLWDSEQKAEALLADFYTNFYGPAREPVRRYFDLCQHQWLEQQGDAVWFRYFFSPTQLELFPPSVCQEARRLLDEATALATSEPYRKRVELTSQAFHMTELYSAVYHAGRTSAQITTGAAAEAAVAALVAGTAAEAERQRYLTEVIDKEPLLKPAIPFDSRAGFSAPAASPTLLWRLLSWCRQNGAAATAQDLIARLAASPLGATTAAVSNTMWNLTAAPQPGLITNGSFEGRGGAQGDTSGADWQAQGAPPGWSYWERNPGAGRLRWVSANQERFVTLTGVKGACFLQSVPVTPGTDYLLLADSRGVTPAGTKATLTMSWKDAKGAWLDEARCTTDLVGHLSAENWRTFVVAGRAPAGAATAIVMLFADNQSESDIIAFDNARLFAVGKDQ